tara:strand:- start:5972 stop:6262 length:291 start_codon:yes stop_codon:yes gene_type:complete
MTRILPVILLLAGCVSPSANLEMHEDLVTGQEYYSIELGISYPKKKFMTPEEWQEYHQSPDSMKEALYRSYKEREKIEEDWTNFINNCLFRGTFDC